MSTQTESPPAHGRPLAATLAGAAIAGTGAWAFFAPRSFYDVVATYPPYNEHFLHDIGAFLIGLGFAFFLAMRVRSGFGVALGANAAAAVMHAISHVIDRDLGGKASDPWLLGLVAVALAVPAVRYMRRGSR